MKWRLFFMLAFAVTAAPAQWHVQNTHTTADLRGIDAPGDGVAWASGSNGTVLRTVDAGNTWQVCAVPPGAANVDLPSVQGFDDKTAVVMTSGKGELSRLYRTTDGCKTWKKVFDNPNPAGSFASLRRTSAFQVYLLADPVNGRLTVYNSGDAGTTWSKFDVPGLDTSKNANVVAAGPAALTNVDWLLTFGTLGPDAAVYTMGPVCKGNDCTLAWTWKATPLAEGGATSGVSAVAGRTTIGGALPGITGDPSGLVTTLVAVGGDPEKPGTNSTWAVVSPDSGANWKVATGQPGGYRSDVAFDPDREVFIAVGPNGTDVSSDNGLYWHPLKPARGDAADADQHWTALSLPFAVGPHGRIGFFDADVSVALKRVSPK